MHIVIIVVVCVAYCLAVIVIAICVCVAGVFGIDLVGPKLNKSANVVVVSLYDCFWDPSIFSHCCF